MSHERDCLDGVCRALMRWICTSGHQPRGVIDMMAHPRRLLHLRHLSSPQVSLGQFVSFLG